jgi:hypothetical protein
MDRLLERFVADAGAVRKGAERHAEPQIALRCRSPKRYTEGAAGPGTSTASLDDRRDFSLPSLGRTH